PRTAATKTEAAEHHENGYFTGSILRRADCHCDFDVDRWAEGVIDAAFELFFDDRLAGDGCFSRLGDDPSYLRHIWWDAADDFALEIFDDFRPPEFPPGLGSCHALAVFQR